LVPERGKLASERNDLGECRRAIGVGDVAAAGGIHHVAAAPEVVEGIVDRDRADAVGVGELDGGLHGAVGGGLTELAVGVPDLAAGNREGFSSILARGTQPLEPEPKRWSRCSALSAVVGADAVARGLGAETRALGGLRRRS
jgi:hypothetical protein